MTNETSRFDNARTVEMATSMKARLEADIAAGKSPEELRALHTETAKAVVVMMFLITLRESGAPPKTADRLLKDFLQVLRVFDPAFCNSKTFISCAEAFAADVDDIHAGRL